MIAGVDEVGRGCFAGPIVAAACAFAPRTALTLRRELRSRSQGASVRGKPVVASAVALAPMSNYQFPITNERGKKIIIDDSKRLKPREREIAAKWIRENALTWGIGEADAALINRIGMGRASKIAFRKAIVDCNRRLLTTAYRLQKENKKTVVGRRLAVDFLLIDAFFIPYVPNLPTKRRKDKRGRFRKNPKGRQQAIVDGDQKSVSIAAASIIAKVYRDKLMLSLSKKSKYKKYGWGRNKGYGTAEHREAIKKYGMTRYHRKEFVATFVARSTQA